MDIRDTKLRDSLRVEPASCGDSAEARALRYKFAAFGDFTLREKFSLVELDHVRPRYLPLLKEMISLQIELSLAPDNGALERTYRGVVDRTVLLFEEVRQYIQSNSTSSLPAP